MKLLQLPYSYFIWVVVSDMFHRFSVNGSFRAFVAIAVAIAFVVSVSDSVSVSVAVCVYVAVPAAAFDGTVSGIGIGARVCGFPCSCRLHYITVGLHDFNAK